MSLYKDDFRPSDILKGLAFILALGITIGALEPSADEDNFLATVFIAAPLFWYFFSDLFTNNDKE